jgi:hypothetical protein
LWLADASGLPVTRPNARQSARSHPRERCRSRRNLDFPRLLKAIQGDVIVLGRGPLEMHSPAIVLLRHPVEVRDERPLAITDTGIMPEVNVSSVEEHRQGRKARKLNDEEKFHASLAPFEAARLQLRARL